MFEINDDMIVPGLQLAPDGRLYTTDGVRAGAWVCAVDEAYCKPTEIVCPLCGLTEAEAFSVACEVAKDKDALPETDPLSAIFDKEILGG